MQRMSGDQATAACTTSVYKELPFSCLPPFYLHFMKFYLFRNERERRIWISCSYLLVCNAVYGHEQNIFNLILFSLKMDFFLSHNTSRPQFFSPTFHGLPKPTKSPFCSEESQPSRNDNRARKNKTQ